jgi:hypothetical protein
MASTSNNEQCSESLAASRAGKAERLERNHQRIVGQWWSLSNSCEKIALKRELPNASKPWIFITRTVPVE